MTICVLSSNFLLEKGHGGILKNNVFVILHVYSGANVSYLASDQLCIQAYSSKLCTWYRDVKKMELQTNAIAF